MTRRGSPRWIVLLLLLALAEPAAAAAAEPAVETRPRVRVTAPSVARSRIIATLVAEDEASLSIAIGKTIVTVPRSEVTRLEVSRRRGRRGTHALIGGALGALAGGVIGYATADKCDDTVNFLYGGCLITPANTGAMGAGAGALLGVLVGVSVGSGEKWETIEPRRRVSVAVAPAPGKGVGATLRVAF